ncbi:MAG TPA: NAD-dependent epimerase/dehydratase family protein [Thermoanaerobaculia bacterium]|nr:NAD-dependent epimerase/dehydratase family protein [Thermoanaerobaculia bacterium]
MHVLVTGGAGFIGSHIVDALIARGDRVTVVDDLSTGDRANVNPRAELRVMDIRDAEVEAVDVIVHHAAQVDVRKSVADPAFDAEVNIVGSIRLLEAAAKAGVKRFVFASSGGAIYGEPVEAPQSETHPTNPLSPYGCAKLSFEHYMNLYDTVDCVALRYANVYGPRQNANGEAGVVAIWAPRLWAGDEVTINGSGEQTRDFVYVDDVVAANLAAIAGDFRGAFNVGTGVETSVNALHALMARIAGATAPPRHAPSKAGEQMRSVLDGSRLRALAGLPEPVALEDGLRRTLEWFRP